MAKKGQAGIEYLMIFAFVLILVLPATYFFYNYSKATEKRITESQVAKIGRDIAVNSEAVYYQGPPSQMVLDEQMPENVLGVFAYRDWGNKVNEIVFRVSSSSGTSEYAFPVNVNTLGFFDREQIEPGSKKIRLAAAANASGRPFVLITFGGSCLISQSYDVNSDKSLNSNDLDVCSIACFNQSASGACQPCDYNGNCVVDNFDLALWKTLVRGSSHPTASVSGPERFFGAGQFIVAASDIDSNLNEIRAYAVDTSTGVRSELAGSPCFFPNSAATTCSVTLASGNERTYYLYVEARDSAGLACSGTEPLQNGTVDCGFDDMMQVSATSAP